MEKVKIFILENGKLTPADYYTDDSAPLNGCKIEINIGANGVIEADLFAPDSSPLSTGSFGEKEKILKKISAWLERVIQ